MCVCCMLCVCVVCCVCVCVCVVYVRTVRNILALLFLPVFLSASLACSLLCSSNDTLGACVALLMVMVGDMVVGRHGG